MSLVSQIILNSLIAGSLYALIALGFNLIYGTTHFFNLAHGSVATFAGYVVFYLTKTFGLALLPSALIAILAAGLVGYLFDRSVFRPLRRKKSSVTTLLVASLGLMTAFQAILAMIFTSRYQTLSGEREYATYQLFGGVITSVQVAIFASAVILTVACAQLLKFTRFGKAVRAVSDDEEVAKIAGLDTDKIIGRVFFLGSAVAGLGGILVGLDTGLTPNMGLSLLFKGVIASIIGGVGNVYGGVLGALLLAFIENLGIWSISGEWKDAIAFGVLILFLLVRPKGIFGK